MSSDPWVERWYVPKSSGKGDWVVSRKQSGLFGCSCPIWRFPKEKDYAGNAIRKECHHIRQIRGRTTGIDSAEVMVRIASLSQTARYKILRDAYLKAGYMPMGYVRTPPQDWQKQRVDELRHDTSISLVCLNTQEWPWAELMMKKL